MPRQGGQPSARPPGGAAELRGLAGAGAARRGELRGLAGVAAALLDRDDPELAPRLARLMAAWPGTARAGVRAGAGLLNAAAVARTGRPLGALPPGERDRVLAAVAGRAAGTRLLDLLKVSMLLAAAATDLPPDPPLVRPDAELDCTPSADWPTCSLADAVVVGSGAGGAVAARELARAGLSVVVLEEGRRHRVSEFRGAAPARRYAELYRDGGATVALGQPPVLLPVGRGVGGTTLVNSGTSLRPPDGVLRRWRDAHGVPAADPDTFGVLLDEVEHTLQVAPSPAGVLGRNAELALAGAHALGWPAAPLPRNAPGCAGSSQCAVGCPTNAKYGVHLSVLPDACAAGARIVTHARAHRILTERGTATGVAARRPDGTELHVLAPLVVVAAGATQTPALLRRSGLGGHPGLGRGMAVHPAVSLAGRFDEPVLSWRGVMQSVGVDRWHADGVLLEATAAPPGLMSFVPPSVGTRLAAELRGADHLGFLGALVADQGSGRVLGRRPWLTYRLADADLAKLRLALEAIGTVLFAAGATEVLTGLARHPAARTPQELRAVARGVPAAELHLAAFHPTGTARMGADLQCAPVDSAGRLRGARGVLVADASVLPTCPEVNPQLAIMAMAAAVARAATGHSDV